MRAAGETLGETVKRSCPNMAHARLYLAQLSSATPLSSLKLGELGTISELGTAADDVLREQMA